ncbi:MAG TPA: ABC transporter permease, partial [Candidatus Binataceae bacterium]|nr:ABC transporter permease [Candidatus Binataceae bacterium]
MFLASFRNNTLLALDTIISHKTRTLLTMLGVIIGTGTIIGVGAILTGFDGAVTNVLRSFGPNAIIVSRTPAFQTGDLTPEIRARKQLTYDNGQVIRAECSSCVRVSAMLFRQNFSVIVAKYKGNAVYQANLQGVEETFLDTGQVDLNKGRFFTAFESRHRAPVA